MHVNNEKKMHANDKIDMADAQPLEPSRSTHPALPPGASF